MKEQIDLCNYTTSSNKRFLKSSVCPAAQCVQRFRGPKGALFFCVFHILKIVLSHNIVYFHCTTSALILQSQTMQAWAALAALGLILCWVNVQSTWCHARVGVKQQRAVVQNPTLWIRCAVQDTLRPFTRMSLWPEASAHMIVCRVRGSGFQMTQLFHRPVPFSLKA